MSGLGTSTFPSWPEQREGSGFKGMRCAVAVLLFQQQEIVTGLGPLVEQIGCVVQRVFAA